VKLEFMNSDYNHLIIDAPTYSLLCLHVVLHPVFFHLSFFDTKLQRDNLSDRRLLPK